MSRLTLSFLTLALGALALFWVLGDGPSGSRRGPGTRMVHAAHGGPATLEGTVRLDEDIPVGHALVAFERTGDPDSSRYTAAVGDDGDFFLSGLPEGSGRLRVGVGDLEEPILVLDDVCSTLDGSVDPRLDEIDLRGHLNHFALRVLDPYGEPVRGAVVGYRESGTESFERAVHAQAGELSIVSPVGVIDVLVHAPGFRTLDVLGITRSRDLVLREGYAVRIALPDTVDPKADGVQLVARVFQDEIDPRVPRRTSSLGTAMLEAVEAGLEDGREATVRLSRPGTWFLEWRGLVDDDVEGWDHRVRFPLGELPRIEVADVQGEQRFTPPFPVEAYRKAIARPGR